MIEKRTLRHLTYPTGGVPSLPGGHESKETRAVLIQPGKPGSFDEAVPQGGSSYSSVGCSKNVDPELLDFTVHVLPGR